LALTLWHDQFHLGANISGILTLEFTGIQFQWNNGVAIDGNLD
jgi:arabinogalactan endo-1,4-beta-galactosidase